MVSVGPGRTRLLAPQAAEGLVVRVLGGLSVQVDGTTIDVRGGLRRRLLLALVSAEERPIGADALTDVLWPSGAATDTGYNALHAHVSRLRRLLDSSDGRGQSWITSHPDGYALRADWVDLKAFESAISRAEADALVDPTSALHGLSAALDLPAEPVQEDFPAWVVVCRRFEHRRRRAEDAWADLAARWGTAGDADLIVELARADPTREVRWIHAMRALARTGRQAQALTLHGEARRQLAEEFGLDLSQDVRRMHEAILRQDPELFASSALTPWAGSGTPLPDTSFVGRHQELDLMDRLAGAARLLTLLGVGGVGKSRLAAEWVHRSGREGISRWVDLRGVRRGQVAARIAGALGVVPPQGDPTNTLDLTVTLGPDLPGLLVLDNADGSIDEVGALLRALLEARPELSVLVTCREALGVSGERRILLRPLAVSASSDGTGTAERLAAARLDPEASRILASRIAQRGSGLPLAIELLAVNPSVQPGSDSDGLPGLVQAVVDTLPDDSVRLLAALRHLPLGATSALAATIAESLGRTRARSQRLLPELAAVSLVTTTSARTPSGNVTIRHQLPPSVDLELEADPDATADLAFAGVAQWVTDHTRDSFYLPPSAGTSELSEDLTTFDAALRWWAGRRPAQMVDVALRLHDFWHQTGQRPLAQEWLRRSLELEVSPLRRAEILLHLSLGGGLAGAAQALPGLDEAVGLLNSAGVTSGPVYAVSHAQRAVGRGWRGDLLGFSTDLAVARACAAAAGSEWLARVLDLAEALSTVARRRPAEGVPPALASARALLGLGDPDGAAIGLYWASLLAGFAQDPQLDVILAEAREVALAATAPTQALVVGEVAKRALARGDADAGEALSAAITVTERAGNMRTGAMWRRDLGLMQLREGRIAAARHQLELATLRLAQLDTCGAALAVGGLAHLRRGRERELLAEAAWALSADQSGAPLTERDRALLKGLIGPRRESAMTIPEATAVITSLVGTRDGHTAPSPRP